MNIETPIVDNITRNIIVESDFITEENDILNLLPEQSIVIQKGAIDYSDEQLDLIYKIQQHFLKNMAEGQSIVKLDLSVNGIDEGPEEKLDPTDQDNLEKYCSGIRNQIIVLKKSDGYYPVHITGESIVGEIYDKVLASWDTITTGPFPFPPEIADEFIEQQMLVLTEHELDLMMGWKQQALE